MYLFVILLILLLNISIVDSVVKCVDDGVCMTCNKNELVTTIDLFKFVYE